MPFVVEFREDVDVTPAGLPGVADFVNIGIIEDAARLARRRHHRRQRHVRQRQLRRRGARRQARLRPGLQLGRRLHRGRADRRHGRPGRQPRRRRRQHVDRRPAGAQRRQQRPRRALQPADRRLRRADRSSRPATAARASTRSATRRWPTDVVSVAAAHQQGDLAGQLRLGRPQADAAVQLLLARPARGRRLQAEHHRARARRSPPRRCGSRASRSPRPATRCRRATRCSTARRWPPRRPPAAAALLLSAAKATDRGVTPAALRRAIYSSADWITGVAAARRRATACSTSPAPGTLLKGSRCRPAATPSTRPVCTPISDFLATPDRGTGIYNRCAAADGGHAAGPDQDVRGDGSPAPAARPATVAPPAQRGSATTARSARPRRSTLPLNRAGHGHGHGQAVGDGAHSAILRVDDPATPAVDYEVHEHGRRRRTRRGAPAYAFSTSGTVDRNRYKSLLRHRARGRHGAAGQPVRHRDRLADPVHRDQPVRRPGREHRRARSATRTSPTRRRATRTCVRTRTRCPGVWEIEVESRRTSPALDNPFKLTAPDPGRRRSTRPTVELPERRRPGVPTPVTWTLTNNFGPVTVHGEGGPLGSALVERPTIADRRAADVRGRRAGRRDPAGRRHRQHQRPRPPTSTCPSVDGVDRRRSPPTATRRSPCRIANPAAGHVHRRGRRLRGAGRHAPSTTTATCSTRRRSARWTCRRRP